MSLMELWQEFRSYGCHLVQVQGKHHLIEGIAIAEHFDLPTMVVFDCDGDTPEDEPGKPTGRRKKQENDNNAIFKLMDAGAPTFPTDTVWLEDVVAWPTKIGDIVDQEIGKEALAAFRDEVRAKRGIDLPNMDKNSLFIGYVMARAWEAGKKSKTLAMLCEHILKFAAAAQGTKLKTGTEAPV